MEAVLAGARSTLPFVESMNMFESENDPPPLKLLLPLKLVVFVVIGSITAFILYIGSATNIFTRGEIGNLPLKEKDTLSRIEQNGVRVVSQPSTGFGAPAQIVPDIIWQYSPGEYAVTEVTILNADNDAVIPELQKLTRLKEIRVPYLNDAEAEKVRTQFPNVVVTRTYK